VALLRTLAADAQAATLAAMDKDLADLKQLSRFPLAPPRPNEAPLPPQQLAAARAIVARLRAAASPPAPRGAAATIEQGRDTGTPGVDAILKQLRTVGLPDGQRQWLDGLNAVLAAIPAHEPLTCTVFVRAPDPVPRAEAAAQGLKEWYSVLLRQDDRASDEVWVARLPSVQQELGTIQYPGGAVELHYFKLPQHDRRKPDDRQLLAGGPWTGLAIVHLRGARPDPASGGKRWFVDAPTPDPARTLPLVVEFPHAIPSARDWPTAK
jgi:hypothetical protein